MNAIPALLDNPTFQPLGWALIHFVWQGALIAVLYAIASVLLRRCSANIRYAAACGAMLLMPIAAAITMFVIGAQETTQNDQAIEPSQAAWPELVAPASQQVFDAPSPTDSIEQWAQDRLPRLMPLVLALWFAGVFFLSLRFAGGLMMIQRLRRVEAGSGVDLWQEKLALLSRRLRLSAPVRLCETVLVEVPTVIGWLRPLILLPASALTGLSAAQLEALLAHELAHIRRHDYLANLIQTSIETLFFYHPAVWWVSAQVRQEREHCCDDLAVAACGDVLTYARALTALEQLRCAEPHLAVAAGGGSLLVRIQRLLTGRQPAYYRFENGLASFIALATVVILLGAAQTAVLSTSARAFIKDADILTLSGVNQRSDDQKLVELPSGNIELPAVDSIARSAHDQGTGDVPGVQHSSGPDASKASSQDDQPTGVMDDFKSVMAAAGLANLKDEQLTALKVSGITTKFVREISARVSSSLTSDHLTAMWIHGVTPDFADELSAQGLANLSADQLIAFRVHGVTSQFINQLKDAGYGNSNANSLLAFRIHGVTPPFIQQMKDLGFGDISGYQLIAFRIHGVTPVFVREMKASVRGELTADDLIGCRIHGVTPEMIKELEILGFDSLSTNQLMAFRIHGVTPGFIRAIQDAGYDRVTPDQLTELKISGVTPEFIRRIKDRGFTDVTLHQLVELRRLNILPTATKN
jgi:beta-lactamase regulating signal transducer with metallopeptidase domain